MIPKIILKAIKPFRLISMITTYILGAGLVQYLKSKQGWAQWIAGIIFILFFSLCLELMRLLKYLTNIRSWPQGISLKEVKMTRTVVLVLIATFLTLSLSIFMSWMIAGVLWQGLVALVILLLIDGAIYYLCDWFSTLKPYQLLFEGLFYVILPPAFAYFLQSEEIHVFLTLVVICLVPAYLALRLLIQIQHFGDDHMRDEQSIVTKIGWERAMIFHNALILLTFVFFALIVFRGFPWFILWPVFLALPIGLVEVWLMERVRRGGKPLWLVMKVATASTLFIPVYLLSFAFWIR
jgi:1,4-dihydroxy-2-naphthoate octaprenyltransferase